MLDFFLILERAPGAFQPIIFFRSANGKRKICVMSDDRPMLVQFLISSQHGAQFLRRAPMVWIIFA
jgi:hypothetical protein